MTDISFPFYLGPYKVVAELGAGGFATVYQAIVEGEMGFARQVALKVLHPHITKNDRGVVKMLADEALLLARMQHPNIVYVQWFGQLDHPTEGKVFAMMMEYVRGKTLRAIQDAGRGMPALPVAVTLDIHLDILKGLRFAHEIKGEDGREINLVHRDLKPDNVMISKEGAVKLLDFGIAKASERLVDKTEANMVRGTVHYMSPEQVRGEEVDFRSDLFAFGSMLYEGLTGARMITGATLISAMHRVAAFQPETVMSRVEEVLPAAVPVLSKFVAQDRDLRYASTAEALSALRKLRDQVPSGEMSSVFLSAKVQSHDPGPAVADTEDISAIGVDSLSVGAVSALPSGSSSAPPPAPSPSDVGSTRPMPAEPPARTSSSLMGPLVFLLGAAVVVFGLVSLLRSERDGGEPPAPAPVAVSDPHSPAEPDSATDPPASDAAAPAVAATPPELSDDAPTEQVASPPVAPVRRAQVAPDPRPAPVVVKPAPKPAPASGEPGRLKVGADSPFELSIAHKRYNQLQAGRGIDLPAGSYRIRLDCIRCPEGVQPTLSLDVEVKAGEETRQILSFNREG